MSEIDEVFPAGLPGGLDPAYLVDAGQAVARYLGRGRASELAFRPGNSTMYELVFVATHGIYTAASWMDHERARSIASDRPEWQHEDSVVLVSWVGHGAWPVDLRHVPHDSYLCEKFADCTLGDAHALRQLLLEVARASGFKPMAVVR